METSKLLTIVVVTWGQADHHLPIFLHSCALQTRKDFKLVVYHDGNATSRDEATAKSYESTRRLVNMFKLNYLPDITFLAPDRTNDYGHSMRAAALGDLPEHPGRKVVDTEYLNWQNGDNYLTPYFVQAFLDNAVKHDLDFVYSDILHNYANVNGDGKLPYNVLNSAPHMNRIDIANFIVRTEWARKTGFNHRSTGADGLFVQELLSWHSGQVKFAKIPTCPLVHN